LADVFISYKSDRRAVVEQLSRVLELNGYSVWYDHALVAGEGFSRAIERELRSARAVVVAWCSLSVTSDWVREEANLAKRLRTLVPVRLERVDMPLGFGTLQSIDLSRWDGAPRSEALDRLLLEVARFVGRDPTPQVRELIAFDKAWRRSGGSSLPFPVAHPPVRPDPAPGSAPADAATRVPERPAVHAPGAMTSPRAAGCAATAVATTGPADAPAAAMVAEAARPRTVRPDPDDAKDDLHPPPARPDWPSIADLPVIGGSEDPAHGHLADGIVAAPLSPPEDRPSLVVLPFANMSGDPEQDYFADGMVEEITGALGRIRWFFVIARNSAFTYKGRAVDVRQVGRELGVRYVLEGSVRKAGGRVRITCQLVEAETGRQLWSERFDWAFDDIFELQDRVTEAVAGALEPKLQAAEIRRATAKPTGSLTAYDLYLRALPHFYAMTRSDNDAALDLLRRAMEADANFALAKGMAALCYCSRSVQQWSEPEDDARGLALAREALAGAGDDPATLRLAGDVVTYFGRDFETGLEATGRAVAINPNSAQAASSAGWVRNNAGEPADAIPLFRRAVRLSPLDPGIGMMRAGEAFAHLMLGDLEAALRYAEESIRQMPTFSTSHRVLIVALWRLGRATEAREAVQTLLRVEPGTRIGRTPDVWRDRVFRDAYLADLRAAGLPE
jgi:adenylate cyclase